MKPLFGQQPLFPGDGTVMDEDRRSCTSHLLGDSFGSGSCLAEEQTLAVAGEVGRVADQSWQTGTMDHEQLSAGRLLWGIDDLPLALRRPLQPVEDRFGVTDGGTQADALHIVS